MRRNKPNLHKAKVFSFSYHTVEFKQNNDISVNEPQHVISNNVVCATAKAQTSLRIGAVWSEPLLAVWTFYDYDCQATDRTLFGVSQFKRRLHRLNWVYTCQNDTLLEIRCHGSNMKTQTVINCLFSGKLHTGNTTGPTLLAKTKSIFRESNII